MLKTARLAALASLLLLPAIAQAQVTVLTFDYPGSGNGLPVDQVYGDNVTAADMGGRLYGGSAPFTPDITVLYSGGNAGPAFWGPDYGDLTNVIYGEPTQLLLVTFTPGNGALVGLNSFDLGGWLRTDYVINSVQVFADGNPVFQQFNVPVEGNAGHSPFVFNNVTATTFLTIQIDATNLGGESDNIGIDNISFTQINPSAAAPEPGTLALLGAGMGLMGMAVIRRRRR